jgi:hypothetical protein
MDNTSPLLTNFTADVKALVERSRRNDENLAWQVSLDYVPGNLNHEIPPSQRVLFPDAEQRQGRLRPTIE